jgi:hypothetical protein
MPPRLDTLQVLLDHSQAWSASQADPDARVPQPCVLRGGLAIEKKLARDIG